MLDKVGFNGRYGEGNERYIGGSENCGGNGEIYCGREILDLVRDIVRDKVGESKRNSGFSKIYFGDSERYGGR